MDERRFRVEGEVGITGRNVTSGFAITSLVLSIVSFFVLGPMAIVAGFSGDYGYMVIRPLLILPLSGFILGIAGIIRINRSNGKITGKGMAITGLIISLFLFIAFLPVSIHWKEKTTISKSETEKDYSKDIELKVTARKTYDKFWNEWRSYIEGSVKNKSEKTIKSIRLAVYFLDMSEKPIHEEVIYPVSTYSFADSTEPLKPNYVREFKKKVEVPSEWFAPNISSKIDSVIFEQD